jgi:hypothetical protein
MATTANRHKYYETLNLIGYGLSKFDKAFVESFGFPTKTAFYRYVVKTGIAETESVVKNRQDLFDGMIAGGKRKGWWQKGSVYKHRRDYIDSLFGELNVKEYTEIVRLSIAYAINDTSHTQEIQPILRSRYKQLQTTGLEAENYFMNNYSNERIFASASLEDARLFGDGYDFQITTTNSIYLAEVKGVRELRGHIRMTKIEYEKAVEYTSQYALTIVSNLIEVPKMIVIFDPVSQIKFEKHTITSEQIFYRTTAQL